MFQVLWLLKLLCCNHKANQGKQLGMQSLFSSPNNFISGRAAVKVSLYFTPSLDIFTHDIKHVFELPRYYLCTLMTAVGNGGDSPQA